MADGNDFFTILIWPAVEQLLRPAKDEQILDIAWGNGVTSRRLAHAGASVTAFDFSAEMISLARKRGDGPTVEYRVADATDSGALLECGVGRFDAALCNMALGRGGYRSIDEGARITAPRRRTVRILRHAPVFQ